MGTPSMFQDRYVNGLSRWEWPPAILANIDSSQFISPVNYCAETLTVARLNLATDVILVHLMWQY